MIRAETIRQILLQYEKYDWRLRRVLLTVELKESLKDSLETIFGKTEIVSAEVDGAWFSRPSQGANTAWELRHLSNAPFALIEVIENDLDDDSREEILQITELQLAEKLEETSDEQGH